MGVGVKERKARLPVVGKKYFINHPKITAPMKLRVLRNSFCFCRDAKENHSCQLDGAGCFCDTHEKPGQIPDFSAHQFGGNYHLISQFMILYI
jgi:hypothetical protein